MWKDNDARGLPGGGLFRKAHIGKEDPHVPKR